jgi:hypothetical protein
MNACVRSKQHAMAWNTAEFHAASKIQGTVQPQETRVSEDALLVQGKSDNNS